jgi:hypothetical protein
MTDIRKILGTVLATKLESATEDDLRALEALPLAEIAHLFAVARDASASVSAPAAPADGTPAPRPGVSLKAALAEVMQSAEKPLTSNEIVARVAVLRPGSEEPSIRSEISRARKLGFIRLQGDPRGGTYTLAAAATSAQRAPSRAPRAIT